MAKGASWGVFRGSTASKIFYIILSVFFNLLQTCIDLFIKLGFHNQLNMLCAFPSLLALDLVTI